MKTRLERPFRPADLASGSAPCFDLRELATELLGEPAARRSGRSSATLVSHPGLTLVLTALSEGSLLAEHRAPGPVTLVGVMGRVTVETEDGSRELTEGRTVAFPSKALHSVQAEEDSAILIVIGGTSGGTSSGRSSDTSRATNGEGPGSGAA